METVMPTCCSTARGEAGQHDGGGGAVQRLGARQVQHRLVDRQRLHQRRQFVHQRAHLAGGGGVFFEVRLDDDRVGAGLQRLEHRHGAFHAVYTGDIAGGGDHAAGAAADDHRARLQLRPVAFLDAGVERVAVDMGDGQPQQGAVMHQRAAARRAAVAGSWAARTIVS